MTPPMVYSRIGMRLTEGFEACRLEPYQDGGGVWTNGFGNTHHVDPTVTITYQRAVSDLVCNIQGASDCVNHYCCAQMRQNEFDAIVDLVFNIGCHAFADSTMLKKLNQHDLEGAAREFERWDMDAGVHVAGLLRRRKAERELFERSA